MVAACAGLVVACAALLAAWAPWRARSAVPSALPASSPSAAEERASTELVSPASEALSERVEAAPAAIEPVRASRLSKLAHSRPNAARSVVVRGRVEAAVSDLERTQVRISAGQRTSHRVQADQIGRFEVEVTQLLQVDGTTTLAPLVVEAEHPICRRASVELPLPPELGEPAQSKASDPIVLEVFLHLEQATCIAGSVTLATPQGERPWVAAFVRETFGGAPSLDGDPRDLPDSNVARVQQDGTFLLRVAPGARYAVVAAVRGLRPQTRELQVFAEGEYRLDFALEPGLSLRGTLSLDGPRANAGTTLNAALDCGATEHESLGSAYGTLCWVNGRLEWAYGIASTDADGRFELTGLCEGNYTLRAVGLGLSGKHMRSVQVGEARAPCDRLELGPVLARAALDFGSRAGRPTTFSLRTPEGAAPSSKLGPFESDERGLALLSLPPHATYEVLAGKELVGSITTGAVGSSSSWRIER
jgi:hypothetical protein